MTEDNHAISNARGWLETIVDMIARLAEADEGSTECGQCEGTGTIRGGLSGDSDDEECPVCDGTGEIESELNPDEIREEIQESILWLEVRSDWHTPNGDDTDLTEYRILLTWGGPALQITGDLDQWKQPESARLQWQDWGTPWTDLLDTSDEEDSAILAFAQIFWFGE